MHELLRCYRPTMLLTYHDIQSKHIITMLKVEILFLHELYALEQQANNFNGCKTIRQVFTKFIYYEARETEICYILQCYLRNQLQDYFTSCNTIYFNCNNIFAGYSITYIGCNIISASCNAISTDGNIFIQVVPLLLKVVMVFTQVNIICTCCNTNSSGCCTFFASCHI